MPLTRLSDVLARRVPRHDYQCLACGHEFEAPERQRVQCPECLGYRVETA
jgi:Zn finger protein HypA/HybF involved in hydrogenase expression